MERKTQGSQGGLVEPLVCKHIELKMKTLTQMDMVVIEDYCNMIG